MIASVTREISPLEATVSQWLERLARIRRKKQLERIRSIESRLVVRRKPRFEFRLPETQIDQLLPHIFCQLRRRCLPHFP